MICEFKKYGAVPREVYSGMEPGRKFYTHEKMFKELSQYMEGVKNATGWNVAEAVKELLQKFVK